VFKQNVVRIGKYLSRNFSIQNGLKQEDALSPLLFNFDLKYTIREVQENKMGLKLKGTHQLPVYADDVNLVEDIVYTIKKKTQTLIGARKEIGLEVNAEKPKYVLLYIHRNVKQNHDIKIANRSSENVHS
jgi:hypothetical protein